LKYDLDPRPTYPSFKKVTMPYAVITYSGDASKKELLATSLSEVVSKSLGKPEAYMAVSVNFSSTLVFGGSTHPAAVVNIQSVGGSCSAVAGPVTNLVVELLGITADRVYVNFVSFPASEWAMNGQTFA
jgi:phenylpyruvate tautomerase PptA (4-oxalocrotonate tautomerase family)